MAKVLIPGLNAAVTRETLAAAAELHNLYPPDAPFPVVDTQGPGFKELCSIIAKYNLQSTFRLRLLHRHFELPSDHVLVSAGIPGSRNIWTAPVHAATVVLSDLRGYVFSVTVTSTVMPAEFRRGPAASTEVSDAFVAEFIGCIYKHDLQGVLGLEAKSGSMERMIETSGDAGSLLVPHDGITIPAHVQEGQGVLQTTGWMVHAKHAESVDDGEVDAASETRCVVYPKKGHMRITGPA